MADLRDASISEYLSRLAARSSTPGGGSAAAISGAQGAALFSMVCEFTRHQPEEISEVKHQCHLAMQNFLHLAEQDVEAFKQVMTWYKKDRSSQEYQQALQGAAVVPEKIMQQAATLTDSAEYLESNGNPQLLTDVAIGANLLAATIQSAHVNVLINCQSITDNQFIDDVKQRAQQYVELSTRLIKTYTRIQSAL